MGTWHSAFITIENRNSLPSWAWEQRPVPTCVDLTEWQRVLTCVNLTGLTGGHQNNVYIFQHVCLNLTATPIRAHARSPGQNEVTHEDDETKAHTTVS